MTTSLEFVNNDIVYRPSKEILYTATLLILLSNDFSNIFHAFLLFSVRLTIQRGDFLKNVRTTIRP